jgi:CHAT domain-containing protein/Tfp pilus assembly protein PilF
VKYLDAAIACRTTPTLPDKSDPCRLFSVSVDPEPIKLLTNRVNSTNLWPATSLEQDKRMIWKPRICTVSLLCFVFSLAAASVCAQTPTGQTLVLNQPLEREIKGGETQFYAVQIGGRQTARIEIEQKGVDVALAAYKSNGERFIETNSPTGVLGNDLLLVTATEAGEYKIAVEPSNPKADAGRYVIKLAEIRPTHAEDHQINEASRKINELIEQAVSLRVKGTREERRQAVDAYRQIIELSHIKKDKTWEIVGVVEMGLIYDQLGELQKYIELEERGLLLSREMGNREHEGSALNNIGNGYKTFGDYEKAIFYLTQALDIQRETNDKRGEAIVLNNLGGCYLLQGNLPKAQELYQQSIILRRVVKDRRGEGNVLNNLGQVFAQSGNAAKAVEYLQQALAVRHELADKTGEAITLRNLARIYWAAGDKTKGIEYFERSNALAKKLGDRRVEAESSYGLALAEKERGNLEKAIETVESGLALIEQIRGELVNPELRVTYFSTVQQFYELYAELLAARYERDKNEADVALALQTSERARARNLVELLREARVNIKQGVDVKLLEQAQDLQERLNLRYRQRTAALAGKSTPEQIAKITNEINSLTTELENLQVKIRRDNPRYADLTQGTTLSAKDIQNLLDDGTVLLEYKLGTARSFLWLVTKDSVRMFTLPARAEIEKTARAFYDATVSHDKTKEAETAGLATKLSHMLLAPAAAEIENKRLAIVADGVLQFVPFAALQSPKPKAQSAKFLSEDYEIVVLPSASVLAELRRNSNQTKTPGKTIAVFADPIFEANDPRLEKNRAVKSSSAPSALGRVLRDFNGGETLPRLLSSREEARNISAFAPKNQAVSNLDFDASRENATSGELANYRILHFATHGLLDSSHPEFSGLVFSLYDKNGQPKDGFLQLNQIYNLNLNSDLVVLSACQTALGKDVRGEGLIGLTRGFMYAGAKSVVASLWKVDDAATAEFMRRFYQNLLQKKLPTASALKQTQNEMRKIPRFRAPYFWAGFTLQGDWR